MKEPVSEFVVLRDRRHHVRIWGQADAPRLFMAHGWGDTSASYQFVVDALRREWRVIAPDWRGFGKSQWNEDSYWFPDYFADLDALLQHYSPDQPVRLVAHSMGGMVALIYAGVRPERVARLVNLEGGIHPRLAPEESPARVRKWLEQAGGERRFRAYPDHAAFARRLMRDNPRMTQDKANFLAEQVTEACEGGIRFAADPCHHWLNPLYFSIDDAMAIWRQASAPVLWVSARDSSFTKAFESEQEDFQARLACFRTLRHVMLGDSGHNMHHDQPETVARLIEEFMA